VVEIIFGLQDFNFTFPYLFLCAPALACAAELLKQELFLFFCIYIVIKKMALFLFFCALWLKQFCGVA
jgi:hypothetical protein